MTDIATSLVNDIPIIIGAVSAVAAAVSSFFNRKKLTKIEVQFNGRVSELVEAEKQLAFHKGFQAGSELKSITKEDGGQDI